MKKQLRYLTTIMILNTLAIIICPRPVLAQAPIMLTDEQQIYTVNGTQVVYLVDPTGQLTIEQISSAEQAQAFVPYQGDTIRFAQSGSVYWFQLNFFNQTCQSDWRLEVANPSLNYVDMYQQIGATMIPQLAGSSRPITVKRVPYHYPVFVINVPAQTQQTIYLQVRHKTAIYLPLAVSTNVEFAAQSQTTMLKFGLFIGILLIMIGYNTFVFISLRDKSYLYYSLFVFSLLLIQLVTDGLGSRYLWSLNSEWWRFVMGRVGGTFVTLFMLQFTRSFLQTRETAPRLDRILRYLGLSMGGVLAISLTPLDFLSIQAIFIPVIVIFSYIMVLATGVVVWWHNYRPARYFLLAWSLFILMVVLYFLQSLGALPPVPLAANLIDIGSVVLVLTLSLGLADRINTLREEKLAVQQTLSETLQNANIQLEQKVAQRTELLEQQAVELREAKIKADSANQAKSDFLSAMSHELRTPLNGILGYAQILRRRQELTADVMNGLNIIYQSGNHLLTLINDILDLSKVEARKMDLHAESVHLTSFLESVVGIIYMRAREKGLEFQQEFKALPSTVMVDEKRLRQVLLNLLGNAVKFTAQGAVTLRVSQVVAKEQQVLLRFEVADSGVGIAGHELEKIFQPFEQTGEAKKRAEGTGLGLTISRQLVELMGGTIQVKSELGQGSLFWFELTLPLGMTEDILLQPGSTSRGITGYEGARRRVLVVDDASSNRYLLKSLLESLGFEIAEAENGATAFDLTLQFRPDLIITDVVMPEVTGFELIEKVRAMPDLAATHIIVVSASSFDMRQKAAVVTEYDGYLSKPIDIDQLLELIGQSLSLEWLSDVELQVKSEVNVEIVALPRVELEELHQYVKQGNMRKIRLKGEALLSELGAEYRPFIKQMLDLARGYEEKKLRALLEQYL